MKVSPPIGGINSGMPNAPGLLSFMVVRSLVAHEGLGINVGKFLRNIRTHKMHCIFAC